MTRLITMVVIIIGLYGIIVYASTRPKPHSIKRVGIEGGVSNMESTFIEVSCTVYNPVKSQCDNTPNVTYDSTEIDIKRASGYRYIGVSHDLVKEGFEMGTLIMVTGIDEYYDGVWEVKDLMNKKWKRKIDFLQSKNHKNPHTQKCYIVKIDKPVIPDSLNVDKENGGK